ncbi:hypothetical protein [Niveibacterium sp. SC-1]|uniref:hypothetical protein n=1 Tax=Niveibacterium sp. SC-1 TaxID=3135646 RepID=UPI00311F89E3
MTQGKDQDEHSEDTDAQLLARVDDADEYTRAQAAVALARCGHPQGLAACLKTIADAAEPTHAYSTPAGWQLIAMGTSALPGVLDVLESEDSPKRLCADFVFRQISQRQFGFDGRQWHAPGYEVWASWWLGIGYHYDGPATEREAAVQRARAACADWIDGH